MRRQVSIVAISGLAPNEREVLDRLAAGDLVEKIADDWGVSPRSVYRHWESARRKLGATTKSHSIAIWCSLHPNTASNADQAGRTGHR